MKTKGTLGFLNYGTGYFEPFDQSFNKGYAIRSAKIAHNDVNNATVKQEIDKNCDALAIWGGADISPSFYNEKPAVECGADETPSRQDLDEVRAIIAAIELGKPIIGVCRGAQMLCAMAGGKLVQHVTGHGQSHSIVTRDGEIMTTSSVHHQMMWPWYVSHQLLAWSPMARSNVYVFNDVHRLNKSSYLEPEVVWFPHIKALAIQGHPEFMSPNARFVEWCNQLVEEFVHPLIKTPVNA